MCSRNPRRSFTNPPGPRLFELSICMHIALHEVPRPLRLPSLDSCSLSVPTVSVPIRRDGLLRCDDCLTAGVFGFALFNEARLVEQDVAQRVHQVTPLLYRHVRIILVDHVAAPLRESQMADL